MALKLIQMEENLKYEYDLQIMQLKTINIETMVAAQY